MQWTSSQDAGFTTATKPWLPIPPSASKYNVEAESKDPDSILNTYKKLLALRKSEAALREGIQASIGNDPDVFAFLRRAENATILVVLNMSAHQQSWGFKVDEYGIPATATMVPLYSSTALPAEPLSPLRIKLEPFAAVVAKLQ